MDSSYLVRCHARPIRVAFLVDPEAAPPELLDAILDFNLEGWGGRHNPIILAPGGKILDSFKTLLLYCDPDIVYSYVSLDQSDMDWIDRRIGPYLLKVQPEQPGVDDPWKYKVYLDGRATPNLSYCISRLRRPFFGVPSVLVSRDHQNATMRRFVRRTFGAHDDSEIWKRLPAETGSIVIDSLSSVREVLEAATSAYPNVIFPLDFCGLDSALRPIDGDYDPAALTIVIGSDFYSIAWHWNRVFRVGGGAAARNLCLPPDTCDDAAVMEAVAAYVAKYSQGRGQQQPHVRVESHEVPIERCEALISRLFRSANVVATYRSFQPKEFPALKWRADRSPPSRTFSESRHVGARAHLSLQKPASLTPQRSGDCWIVEADIEFQADRSPFVNRSLEWILPPRLAISRLFGADRQSAHGSPCILVSDASRYLELSVPTEEAVFRAIAMSVRGPKFTDDARERPVEAPYFSMALSDKGQIAQGVLDLIGGLSSSMRIFSSRIWTDVLEGVCKPREEQLRIEVQNKLRKRFRGISEALSAGNHEEAFKLAEKLILWTAARMAAPAPELTEEYLFKKVEAVANGINSSLPQPLVVVEREAVLSALQAFVESKVFFQGTRPRCGSCGEARWVSVDDIRHEMRCSGCLAPIRPGVEATWVYRLNALVLNAVGRHGTIPLLCTLGHLLYEARDGFLFVPSVALFATPNSSSPDAECDFLAIVDGRFVLGEVKTSANDFSEDDLRRLAGVCSRLLPDKCVLSAYRAVEGQTATLEKRFKAHLGDLTVDVCAMVPARRNWMI
jgi:hypothetical protein